MKKSLQKLLAVLLSLVMLTGIGSVVVFAEDAAETTTVVAETEPEADSSVADGLNFFQKIANMVYDFLDFLHQQFLTFGGASDGFDPFWWLFEGIF